MSGRPNKSWMATMIAKHGSREAVREYMQEMGALGGRNGHTGGFAANPELARIAGAKGGRISRRRPRSPQTNTAPVEPPTLQPTDTKTFFERVHQAIIGR